MEVILDPVLFEYLFKVLMYIAIWFLGIRFLNSSNQDDIEGYNGIVMFFMGILLAITSLIIFKDSGLNDLFLFVLIGSIELLLLPIFYGKFLSFNKQKTIKIILLGSMERIGTTTIALNIANYLSSLGLKVSYTEGNSNNHLQAIHNMYFKNKKIVNNSFVDKDLNYFFSSIPNTSNEYDFAIVDLGKVKEDNIDKFNSTKDIKILCGGNKPWEVKNLSNSIEKLKDMADYHILIPKDSSINIKEYIPDYSNYTIHELDFIDNIFDKKINKDLWEYLLSQYILKYLGD